MERKKECKGREGREGKIESGANGKKKEKEALRRMLR